jgi:hypothetical protein
MAHVVGAEVRGDRHRDAAIGDDREVRDEVLSPIATRQQDALTGLDAIGQHAGTSLGAVQELGQGRPDELEDWPQRRGRPGRRQAPLPRQGLLRIADLHHAA